MRRIFAVPSALIVMNSFVWLCKNNVYRYMSVYFLVCENSMRSTLIEKNGET